MAERTKPILGTDQREAVDAAERCDGKGPDCGDVRCGPCAERAARETRHITGGPVPPWWQPGMGLPRPK